MHTFDPNTQDAETSKFNIRLAYRTSSKPATAKYTA